MRSDGKDEVCDERTSREAAELGPAKSEQESRHCRAFDQDEEGTEPWRKAEFLELGREPAVRYGVVQSGQDQRPGESAHYPCG